MRFRRDNSTDLLFSLRCLLLGTRGIFPIFLCHEDTKKLEQMGTVQAFLHGQPTVLFCVAINYICFRGNYPYTYVF